MSSIYTSGGYARGQNMPVDSERRHKVLPVVGGGSRRGHRYIVVGVGL